jgi:predicted RNA binding protein YcfA (HicA-like mRNA interferase family)
VNLSPKSLISLLEQHGFLFKRAKGSHQLYYNPETNVTVTVPVHGGKDLKKGTFLAILKQAGIDKDRIKIDNNNKTFFGNGATLYFHQTPDP